MYIFYSRKDIINKLNSYLEDYYNMKELCSVAGNDPKKVFSFLKLIIKYVLKYHFSFIKNTNDIVDCYYNAIKYNEKKNSDILNCELKESDLKGIRIPSVDFINQLCERNIIEEQEIERKNKEKEKRFDDLRGFNEVGFTYTRPEMVRVGNQFNYYYTYCTGDSYHDYYQLYKDERYSNEESDNPLSRDYYDNLDSIKYSNNIQICKYGNLYEIENGRHRLVYLLYHGWDVDIPCTVTRRIESREFNIITYKLKRNYHASIYKNNLMNDEPNILICLYGKMYKTNGVSELKDFYAHINDQQYLGNYYVSHYGLVKYDPLVFYKYKKELIEYLSEAGLGILNMDFSDFLKIFPRHNDSMFYEAYNQLKVSFLRSRVFKSERDFTKSLLDEYKNIISSIQRYEERNNKIR